jgi:transposase
MKSQLAIHLLAASLASGSMLSRTRASLAPAQPVLCILDDIACGKCGGLRLHKLGEAVSKTLECEPRRWKIVEHVREKFSCWDCEVITEPPAPSHAIPRLCRA